MKKANIVRLAGALVLVCGAVLLLSFVGKLRSSAPCSDINIDIKSDRGFAFVQRSEIERCISAVNQSVIGTPLAQVDCRGIEAKIEEMPAIKNAQVYQTINNKLKVEVEERIPLFRLVDKNGLGCYVDVEGSFMPLSNNYTARVLVITGDFEQSPKLLSGRHFVTDTLANKVIQDFYEFAQIVDADPFWKSQIQQAHYSKTKGIIAIPRVGNHDILFGKGEDLEQKFARLRIFYDKGLTASNWNSYRSINLNYKDQIVCTKK